MKSDVWSLGVSVIEMAEGRSSFWSQVVVCWYGYG